MPGHSGATAPAQRVQTPEDGRIILEQETVMQPSAPDLLDLRVRRMIAIVGAVLCVVGWFQYLA